MDIYDVYRDLYAPLSSSPFGCNLLHGAADGDEEGDDDDHDDHGNCHDGNDDNGYDIGCFFYVCIIVPLRPILCDLLKPSLNFKDPRSLSENAKYDRTAQTSIF